MNFKRLLAIFVFFGLVQPALGASGEAHLEGLNAPVGMAYDKDGRLYVAEWGARQVSRFKNGEKETFLSGLRSPGGLAFDNEGNLYIAGYGDGNIYRWTGSGKPTIVANGFSSPTGLFWDSDSSLLIANRNAGEVVKLFPDGRKEIVSKGHNTPVGIARVKDGNLFVSCYGGSVDLVTPDGKITKLNTSLATPGVGIVSASENSIFVVDYVAGKVAEVDAQGNTRIIAQGLSSPVGLVRMADGNLLVSCWDDGTARIIKP